MNINNTELEQMLTEQHIKNYESGISTFQVGRFIIQPIYINKGEVDKAVLLEFENAINNINKQ